MYFDSEVNKILSRIKRSKLGENKTSECDVEIGKKKKLMNCKNIMNKGNKKLINNYKNNILKESFKDGMLTTKASLKQTKKKTSSQYSKINQKNL